MGATSGRALRVNRVAVFGTLASVLTLVIAMGLLQTRSPAQLVEG